MLRLTTPHNATQHPTTHTTTTNHHTSPQSNPLLYADTTSTPRTKPPNPHSQQTPYLHTPLQRTPQHTPTSNHTPHSHHNTLTTYTTNTSTHTRPHATQDTTAHTHCLRILVSLVQPGLDQFRISSLCAFSSLCGPRGPGLGCHNYPHSYASILAILAISLLCFISLHCSTLSGVDLVSHSITHTNNVYVSTFVVGRAFHLWLCSTARTGPLYPLLAVVVLYSCPLSFFVQLRSFVF